MQVSAHDENQRRADALAAAVFDALDEIALVESLRIEDEHGEDALDALADAWCRSVSLAEIVSCQEQAEVITAPVVRLPMTSQELIATRSAA